MNTEATPQLDWAGINRLEQTITEADMTNPANDQGPTLPETASTPPARQKRTYTKPQTYYHHGVTTAVIINELAQYPMSLGTLMVKTGRSRNAVWKQLQRLLASNKIVKLGRGFYGLGFNSGEAVAKAASFCLTPKSQRTVLVVTA